MQKALHAYNGQENPKYYRVFSQNNFLFSPLFSSLRHNVTVRCPLLELNELTVKGPQPIPVTVKNMLEEITKSTGFGPGGLCHVFGGLPSKAFQFPGFPFTAPCGEAAPKLPAPVTKAASFFGSGHMPFGFGSLSNPRASALENGGVPVRANQRKRIRPVLPSLQIPVAGGTSQNSVVRLQACEVQKAESSPVVSKPPET